MPPKKTTKVDTNSSTTSNSSSTVAGKGKGKAKTTSSEASSASSSKTKTGSASSKLTPPDDGEVKAPSVRQIIGGASWTGKLPQTLFYELTVREKWEKPEYTMRRSKDGYISNVIIRNTNPKTKEVEEVHFNVPNEENEGFPAGLPSALEARHFAATYALFRVSSTKNVHFMLPPTYKDFWSQFQLMKKKDLEKNKDWKYNADPFLTQREFKAAEAERIVIKAKKQATSTSSSASGLVNMGKGWDHVPIVEMGQRARAEVEKLVRSHHIWQSNDVPMDIETAVLTADRLEKLGFRRSHAEEACEWTRTTEEALEWLLIHVPEDDLPSQFLPDNYKAGAFAFVPQSLAQEYAAKRISLAGYSIDLAREALSLHVNDEHRASESLQKMLMWELEKPPFLEEDLLSFSDATSSWAEEQESLKAIFGDRFHGEGGKACKIDLDLSDPNLPKKIALQIREPYIGQYPEEIPTLAILTEPILPAYMRLSLIRQMAEHAETLIGQPMVFDIMDWLDNNFLRVIEFPGRLQNVAQVVSGKQEKPKLTALTNKKKKREIQPIDWSPGSPESLDLLKEWEVRRWLPKQKEMLKQRQSLPAWNLKEKIVNLVNENQVTIITGETGSGKSTQTLQFLLEDFTARKLGAIANMLCTQPRRISAIGLAERVSAERCSQVGSEIGYAIRGESKVGPKTKIVFMTTGVLLRRLQSGDTLEDITHVFVDEVHERSLDTDFLLILLKRMLEKRKDLKVILMSATVDAETFANFFGGASMVHIEGRTFPVNDFYLDDVLKFTSFDAHSNGGRSKPLDEETTGMDPVIGASIRAIGAMINYDLIADTVDYIDRELMDADGAILVFLPGTMEINKALKAINSLPDSSRFYALPLHASLMPSEQRSVFPRPPKGKRKVICSTNVAETSITIEDVVAVIDTGKVKETSYDPVTNMVRLAETWASRAACKQRRGRAGRVREGNCYKLYTRHAEQNKMPERPDPEILRIPLVNLCLSVKGMGVRDVGSFLSQALTPPSTMAVEEALSTLQKIGAVDEAGLTGLGKHLSTIPADLRCAKLMIYGAMFGCVNAALTIASILAARSPFVSPIDKREESKAARTSFSPQNGDLLADMRAYENWSIFKKHNTSSETRRWCEKNFLSQNTLQDISSNISQHVSALQETGFLPFSYKKSDTTNALNAQNDNDVIIRAIVAGAFTPQLAKIGMPEKKYASTVSGAKEIDPEAKTIKYFTQEDGRIFLHPSTTLFDAQSFVGNARFLAYVNKLQTGKLYLRDLTPINSYSLLLFGGNLRLDMTGKGLIIDGWLRLRGYPRIGCLVNRLRMMLDELLLNKIDDPSIDIQSNEVVKCVRKLIEWDGMDSP